MLLLTTTADLVRIVTGGAQALHVHASWVDLTVATGATTPGRANTVISSATTTTVVPSPGSGVVRNVRYISIRNVEAAAAAALTVQHTDGTTAVELFELTLTAGWRLGFTENGWTVTDAAGARMEGATQGRLIGTTVLTAASGTFTTNAQTKTLFVRMVGGGAGGGGCTSVASAAAAGGGGGSGAYLEKTIAVQGATGYAYACGAAGNGVSGAAGQNGGSTTLTVGATTYTAPGGTGGVQAVASTALSASRGGAGAAIATNGDLNAAGRPGDNGVIVVVAGPVGQAGSGGSSPLGSGGDPRNGVGNGNNATGFGSGGSGGLTGASTARTGGNGTGGAILIDEFS